MVGLNNSGSWSRTGKLVVEIVNITGSSGNNFAIIDLQGGISSPKAATGTELSII